MSEVIIGFQIFDALGYDDEIDREFMGVFTSIDRLELEANLLDPGEAEGSCVCYYIAELDAPGSRAQWELLREFPAPSPEQLRERREQEEAEREARITRNRKEFFTFQG